MNSIVTILLAVVVLVVLFGLTERWRIEWQAKRKRERQNRTRPDA
jgi:type II secretory pathway component PulK